MAYIKNQPYVLEFTLRDNARNRYLATDESANIIVSVSLDGDDFVAVNGVVSPVKKSNTLTGVYKVTLSSLETGNSVGILVEHPTLYPEPDFFLLLSERGIISDIKQQTDRLTFDADNRVQVRTVINEDKSGYNLVSSEYANIWNVSETNITAGIGNRIKTNLDDKVSTRAIPGDAMTLTSVERDNIVSAVWNATTRTLTDVSNIVSAIFGHLIEGTKSFAEYIRIVAAVLFGNVTGGQTGNITIKSPINTNKTRVSANVDQYGNRNVAEIDGNE